MIITIDGPAAAGKSTVARALAAALGFEYLDTGAMYRAVAWKALTTGVNMHDPKALSQVAAGTSIEFVPHDDAQRVLCDGKDVTVELRTPEVTACIRYVADEPAARKALIEQQKRFAEGRCIVTEGRDQGTDVFPDADVKFYLDASPEERARRRLKDLVALGIEASLEQVRQQVAERDKADMARPVGALRLTSEMVVIDSTCLTVEKVVSKMVEHIARRCGERPQAASGATAAPRSW